MKYVLTSPKFQGSVSFDYDEADQLFSVTCDQDTEPHVRFWFIRNAPVQSSLLTEFVAKQNEQGKSIRMVKLETEISFDMMYQRYGHHKDKKRAEMIWNRLSKANQIKAYLYVPKYDRYLVESGTGKKYLKTYLKDEVWND